jgi:hypothetical protein
LVTVDSFRWVVRPGAIVCHRHGDTVTVLIADQLGIADGVIVDVENGKIQKGE